MWIKEWMWSGLRSRFESEAEDGFSWAPVRKSEVDLIPPDVEMPV